jgi:hypothetical protein
MQVGTSSTSGKSTSGTRKGDGRDSPQPTKLLAKITGDMTDEEIRALAREVVAELRVQRRG